MNNSEFSARLKEACLASGVDTDVRGSHVVLSKKWGVSRSMVSCYFSGEKLPSMATLITISKSIQANIEWLATGSNQIHTGALAVEIDRLKATYGEIEAVKLIRAMEEFIKLT